MRRTTFGLALVASSILSACASTSATRSGVLSETVTAPRPQTRVASVAAGLGAPEQAPMRAAPRVSIRAEVSNDGDSRRVRGVFRTEDDAYVVVGHIDADGVLRIAFPSDPQDDGFVRGNRSYQTNEFFAGFNSQYRFRARSTTLWNTVAAQDAYDGGFGYVFIIASSRPMRFDQFSDGYRWDTFELANDSYMNDPRPAIEELATRIAGNNTDTYTVQFAPYTTTEVISSSGYAGYDGYGAYNGYASGYSAGFCNGYSPFGFASLGYARFGPSGSWGLGYGGYNSWYRGTGYYYDAFGDCYRSYGPYGFGAGYRIVQLPVAPPPPVARPRIFDVTGHRPSPRPQPLPGHFMPMPPQTAPGEAQIEHRTAPGYRERTTPTDDGNATGPARRQPRIEAPAPVEHRERPIIQQLPRRADPRTENPRPEQPRMATPRSEPARPPQPPRVESPKPASRPEARPTPRSEPVKTEVRKPPR